ncbi:hypothetical protein A4R26_13625 [Niastella populi]|uniref:Uncharacterized protein n=1 Tax=Niastella populi TaxID=550983 RepID=A0A1V9G6K7_9BACT|nr:hypothetical protein A4R26_13625 [Niastella populi]
MLTKAVLFFSTMSVAVILLLIIIIEYIFRFTDFGILRFVYYAKLNEISKSLNLKIRDLKN